MTATRLDRFRRELLAQQVPSVLPSGFVIVTNGRKIDAFDRPARKGAMKVSREEGAGWPRAVARPGLSQIGTRN